MPCEICELPKPLGAMTIFDFRPSERDLYRLELCGICIDCMQVIEEFIRVKQLGYLDCLPEHVEIDNIKEDKRRKHIGKGKRPENHDMGQQLIKHA